MENKGVIYILTNPSFPDYVKYRLVQNWNIMLIQV